MSEASFSLDQFHYRMYKDSIRVRANNWDLAFAMLIIANFVRFFHSWVMRLGADVLDPGYFSALDVDVFTAAIAKVKDPLGASLKTMRGKPPPAK